MPFSYGANGGHFLAVPRRKYLIIKKIDFVKN